MEYSYRKPKKKVIKVLREKELEELMKSALLKYMPKARKSIESMDMKGFLSCITSFKGGGEAVLIIEQDPLHSMEAHGKFGDEVFCVVQKTGTQYSKKYVKPSNPQTEEQEANRNLWGEANQAWNILSQEDKNRYDQLAEGTDKTGQNLFISNFMISHQE